MSTWLQAAHTSEEAIERQVDDLVKKGQLSLDEAKKLKSDIVERTREYMARVDASIDERVADVLKRLSIPSQQEVAELTGRLDELASQLDRLAAHLEDRSTSSAEA